MAIEISESLKKEILKVLEGINGLDDLKLTLPSQSSIMVVSSPNKGEGILIGEIEYRGIKLFVVKKA